MAKSKKHDGPVRLLTDLSTSEWFWVASDEKTGELTVLDSDSYTSEYAARQAAAKDHDVAPEEVERAGANPTEDEVDA